MRRSAFFLLASGALSAVVPPALSATQGVPDRTEEELKSLYEAHRGDFDYLLGEWTFTSVHAEYGEGRGYWTAVRLPEGQILDEYRIVGEEGETWYVTTTVRAYNAVLDRWELIGMDGGSGLQDTGTGRRVGDEVHIEQTFGAMSPAPSLWRIRYYDIRPDRFSWSAARSTDGGMTFQRDYLRIEARRIGPPRSMEPLAPGRPAGDPGT